ncbi:GNAT family N-acetyltransferase [Curtobacterium sp. AB451]|uniref:GNAT family N-acetyltransferase n=1 Tax=Curtobacterium sp. AB451 TaxID=3422306 RepID=UPI003D32EA60
MIDQLHLPTTLQTRTGTINLRSATPHDLDAIIELLSDDAISAGRGDLARDEDRGAYADALRRITIDPCNELLIATDPAGTVIGTLQLTLILGMARRGSTRLLVEAVRVANAHRSQGIGGAMMRWVVERAAADTATHLVQLTSDNARADAHRFYRRFGFVDTHIGFKYAIAPSAGVHNAGWKRDHHANQPRTHRLRPQHPH